MQTVSGNDSGMLQCIVGGDHFRLHSLGRNRSDRLGSMEKDKELQELDTAMFSRAPAEAMRQTIDYLNTQYGSIKGYLDSIGFPRSSQARLAAALA